MEDREQLDLEAYLERIGYRIDRQPTFETLRSLQSAHLSHIPFENIDVALHRPVKIDLPSLQNKLVRGGRGGYCFEQNTLFASVLREMGFDLHTLEARVRPPGETETMARTHMVLRVFLDGESWLVDVGFGGRGSIEPISFNGDESHQTGMVYRLVQEATELYVLQRRPDDDWEDLYAFGPIPALPIDYLVGNHFTSTYPDSIFRRMVTVQLIDGDVRHSLRDRFYTIRDSSGATVHELELAEIPPLVRSRFGLDLADEEILAALDQNS